MQMLMKVGRSENFCFCCFCFRIQVRNNCYQFAAWSCWKDRICSRTSKSDWRFGSRGENRHLRRQSVNIESGDLIWMPGWISKASSCQTWEGAGHRGTALRVDQSRGFVMICVLSQVAQRCVNRVLFGSKVKAVTSSVTSPRVLGCNCHQIRSRTPSEISKALVTSTHWLCERRSWNKVRAGREMCQVCRLCGWQGTSLPAFCPCQGSHLRHFQVWFIEAWRVELPVAILFGDFCFQPKAFRLSQELLQNSQEVIEISQEL